jgi:hypothetical protein
MEELLKQRQELENALRPKKCTGARKTDKERKQIMEDISKINSQLFKKRASG